MKEESILTGFADTNHAVVVSVRTNEDGELVFTAGSAFHEPSVLKARHRDWMYSKLDEWVNEQLTKEKA
jgi:hypothetical protein